MHEEHFFIVNMKRTVVHHSVSCKCVCYSHLICQSMITVKTWHSTAGYSEIIWISKVWSLRLQTACNRTQTGVDPFAFMLCWFKNKFYSKLQNQSVINLVLEWPLMPWKWHYHGFCSRNHIYAAHNHSNNTRYKNHIAILCDYQMITKWFLSWLGISICHLTWQQHALWNTGQIVCLPKANLTDLSSVANSFFPDVSLALWSSHNIEITKSRVMSEDAGGTIMLQILVSVIHA